MSWLADASYIIIALLLVALNGFFVAAEFALVKVRGTRLDMLVKDGRPMARLARFLGERLDASLSACQLGITMASLGLGWVGEPAFARLLKPLLHWLGIDSPNTVHAIGFAVAFTAITALHLVVGEQAPKIFAIRRPEPMLLWCAAPLAAFYFLAYPLLAALNATTGWLLRLFGVKAGEHDQPHSEEEIRALVSQAHVHGELTPAEHRLIQAVFAFDDLICRRVMVPRNDVVCLLADQPLDECLRVVQQTQHTRYPVATTSLDDVIGILHIKDLVGVAEDAALPDLVRPAHHVPETIPISRLLRHFQSTHQLMALVDDEYGTVVGIVTLENVLEQIVGSVEDEFDREQPPITREGPHTFVALGATPLSLVNEAMGTQLDARDVDTVSGLLTETARRALNKGDQVELDGAVAEVLEVDGTRATKVRLQLPEEGQE